MYAVIQLGSEQFKVSQGDLIEANIQGEEVGKKMKIDKVLLFSDDKEVLVGKPTLKNVEVSAKVIELTKGKKKIAFKYRRRKSCKKTIGHRQKLTAIAIEKISAK